VAFSKEKIIEKLFSFRQEVALGLGLVLIAVGLVTVFKDNPSSEIEIIPAQQEPAVKAEIIVDIEGAVVNPGIYRLPPGSRVADLLIASKGLDREADRDWVAKNLNRAAVLADGAKIYIPKAGEAIVTVAGEKTGGVVNINQADQAQLESLPGIGPSSASKIIEYRNNHGGFKSIEELMSVPGIGRKSFEKLKERVSIY
jgi:competence protein ComEA